MASLVPYTHSIPVRFNHSTIRNIFCDECNPPREDYDNSASTISLCHHAASINEDECYFPVNQPYSTENCHLRWYRWNSKAVTFLQVDTSLVQNANKLSAARNWHLWLTRRRSIANTYHVHSISCLVTTSFCHFFLFFFSSDHVLLFLLFCCWKLTTNIIVAVLWKTTEVNQNTN